MKKNFFICLRTNNNNTLLLLLLLLRTTLGHSHSHCQIIISIIIITIVYLVVVGDFEVGACVASAGGHEVGVDERVVGGDDVVECSVEICLHAISQQIAEPATVVVTDEAISKHSLTLVIPQAHQLRQRLHANNNDNNNMP